MPSFDRDNENVFGVYFLKRTRTVSDSLTGLQLIRLWVNEWREWTWKTKHSELL